MEKLCSCAQLINFFFLLQVMRESVLGTTSRVASEREMKLKVCIIQQLHFVDVHVRIYVRI